MKQSVIRCVGKRLKEVRPDEIEEIWDEFLSKTKSAFAVEGRPEPHFPVVDIDTAMKIDPQLSYEQASRIVKSMGILSPVVLKYITGDLFKSPVKVYAHCIATDLRLGAGIAVVFKRMHPKMIGYLKEFDPQVGDAIAYADESATVINLFTKKNSSGFPTENDFKRAIDNFAILCKQRKIYAISIPRIGTGLDRLTWSFVEKCLVDAFSLTSPKTKITVFTLA